MLRFDDQGEFRILILADIQDVKPLDDTKQNKLKWLIEKSNPALIVLLGDMIFGSMVHTERKVQRIISSILQPIQAYEKQFVFVTGNHDVDSRVSVDKQVNIYCEAWNCIAPILTDRICKGSYSHFIYDEDRLAIQLIFHDSGATHYTFHGAEYDPISSEQLDYEKETLNQLSDVPAYVFQHIPVPEINELLIECDEKTTGAIKAGNMLSRRYVVLKDPTDGTLGEYPCPPKKNSGQFGNWVQRGNVKVAVFGHDHKNSFCGTLKGIDIIQTSCAGLSCYGDDRLRGGRMLIIRRDGTYCTREITYNGFN